MPGPADDTVPSVARHAFEVRVDGREVPIALWLPAVAGPRPLVLVGHGGSGHKTSSFVTDAIEPLARVHGIAVAAIDGPVHGARRAVDASPEEVRDEFRALWERGGSVEPMVVDWRAALDALVALPQIDASALGYYGLSMGTAYGLPLLAAEPRVRAAVIGMWGTSRANSARLVDDARRVRCSTLFCVQWDDPLFTREGQFELFDALAVPDKRMTVHPGGHENPNAVRLAEIVAFLASALARAAQSP